MSSKGAQRRFNRELSLYIRNRISAKPNACFSNAVEALALVPNSEYVEGFIRSPSTTKPYRHAWLEVEGDFVDPSLPDGNHEYFFARKRTRTEYLKFAEEVENLKNKDPISLTEEMKRNLPEPVQEAMLNPDYHSILVHKMMLNDKTPEFNLAYKRAMAYKSAT